MKTKNSRPHLWGLKTQLVSVHINSQTVHAVRFYFPPMATGMNSNKTAHESVHSHFLPISRENYMVSFSPRYWAGERFMLHTCCYIFNCLFFFNPKSNAFCKFCSYVCFMARTQVALRHGQVDGSWRHSHSQAEGQGYNLHFCLQHVPWADVPKLWSEGWTGKRVSESHIKTKQLS